MMISPVLRMLTVSVLLSGALAGGALAGSSGAAQPAIPSGTPCVTYGGLCSPTPTPGTPTATPPLPILTFTPLTPPPPPTVCHRNSFSNSQLFPETGYTVGGEFINYWGRNGDLAQQGYPISNVIEEVSELDGRRYTVQYFERTVFECHPENFGNQYIVLLTQLGTFQYQQKYPQGAPDQRPNSERPKVFAQTRRTIGGEFRTYWEEHGGVAQQGLPISNEFSEVSPLDGKRYTVQYFERAVFEYHPENAPPYRVLLSQLGTLRYRAKYPTPPPPLALPTPNPTGAQLLGYVPASFDCSGLLATSSSYVFWPDANSPYQAAVLGYDVNSRQQLSAVKTRDLRRSGLVTEGRTAVWQETLWDQTSGTSSSTIHGYDLGTGRAYPLLHAPEVKGKMAISADTLYYLTGGSMPWRATEVNAHNWATGQTTRLATARPGFSINGVVAGNGYLAWTEQTLNYEQRPLPGGRIYLAPAGNPAAATVINVDMFEAGLIIAGDHLLWNQAVLQADGSFTYDDVEVRMYTISTRTTQVLDRGRAVEFSASADRIAWRPAGAYANAATARTAVLDFPAGRPRIQQLPTGTAACVTLVGSALAYIQYGSDYSRNELYLQPLP